MNKFIDVWHAQILILVHITNIPKIIHLEKATKKQPNTEND